MYRKLLEFLRVSSLDPEFPDPVNEFSCMAAKSASHWPFSMQAAKSASHWPFSMHAVRYCNSESESEMIHQKMRAFQDFTTQSIFAVTSRRSGTVQNRPVPALADPYLLSIAPILHIRHPTVLSHNHLTAITRGHTHTGACTIPIPNSYQPIPEIFPIGSGAHLLSAYVLLKNC